MPGPWEQYQQAPAADGPWSKYKDTTNDAVAQPRPAPDTPPGVDYSLFRSEFASPQLPPGYGKEAIPIAERALLTNEPTQSMPEEFLRGVPANIGGAVGGTLGFVAGAPTTVGAVATGAAGAALGGAGMEGARQTAAQLYTGLTGRGEVKPAGYVVGEMAKQGAMQIPANILSRGTGLIAQYYGNRLPSTLKQFFGIAEPVTKYVQNRGSAQVFTSPNLTEGAPLANVGQATRDLAARRAAVGQSIGNSEDFILDLGASSNPIKTDDIAAGLRNTMTKQGYLDPRTADLARGKDVGLLNTTLDTLGDQGPRQITKGTAESASPILDSLGRPVVKPGTAGITLPSEPLTLRQAINTKRLIDQQLDFGGQLNREISDPAAAIAKGVNAQLRDRVRAELGPQIGKLYDDFGVIADAQEKLAEFTGTKALSNVEQRAVQSLRGIMLKNPDEVGNIVQVLGDGLPGGKQQAWEIFDSIAGQAFTKDGVGAPSNAFLKAATANGMFSGPTARGMVRAGEALNRAAVSPLLDPSLTAPASSAIYDAYSRQPRTAYP